MKEIVDTAEVRELEEKAKLVSENEAHGAMNTGLERKRKVMQNQVLNRTNSQKMKNYYV